ncbi:MAG: hypothetical protein R8P61_01935 [Bacteroidia bacterium]|nr:hypothetical protein [Bacteroidia bacterium]
MKTSIPIKIPGAILALSLLFYLANLLLGIPFPEGSFVWGLLSNLLIVGFFYFLMKKTTLSGYKLMGFLFCIYFIIGHFNILIEAYIFNVTDQSQTLKEILRGFIVAGLFALILLKLFGQGKEDVDNPLKKRSVISWSWRILLADFLYMFCYGTAGFILVTIYPQLLDFYEGKIPPFPLVLKTQLFLRGLVFAGIAVLMDRYTLATRLHKGLLIGACFSILGGLAPLIAPNELMPAYVRFGHAFEVGISNFLYGFVLTYLIGRKQAG